MEIYSDLLSQSIIWGKTEKHDNLSDIVNEIWELSNMILSRPQWSLLSSDIFLLIKEESSVWAISNKNWHGDLHYRPRRIAKQSDNALGSVHPSIYPFICWSFCVFACYGWLYVFGVVNFQIIAVSSPWPFALTPIKARVHISCEAAHTINPGFCKLTEHWGLPQWFLWCGSMDVYLSTERKFSDPKTSSISLRLALVGK